MGHAGAEPAARAQIAGPPFVVPIDREVEALQVQMPELEPRTAPTPAPTAVVVAADEETRVLLRGLLRLHRVRVVGESDGLRGALELLRTHQPPFLIADSMLTEGSIAELVERGREAAPGIKVILVAPSNRATPGGRPDVVLLRPFRIRQLAEALGAPPLPGRVPGA
jgi:CheY-like chemotaxis protein